MGRDNGNLNTLKPQPGQYDSYHPKFHPLPGVWAQEQLNGSKASTYNESMDSHKSNGLTSSQQKSTEIDKAIAAEEAQHRYWEEWQGVTPGKAVYEDPRAFQNTLLPTARFGTDGR